MITCKDMSLLTNLQIDGELPDDVLIQIDRHLLHCRECAFLFRSIELSTNLLKETFHKEPSAPEYRERALARLNASLTDVLIPPLHSESNQWPLPFLREESA